ncbi:hypothetical protein CSC67_08550 [Pusillimonas caeni]|uniref:hypothetical protein n=1 Tax=Pusillimonas caeni TaxID=1348472 RepID=UPI000E59DA2F|nr:hypothetical protein [Pusillimonas caeni]TFL14192.1 hypothetical protein CSC67_08550 [Pusillimonas caeni]
MCSWLTLTQSVSLLIIAVILCLALNQAPSLWKQMRAELSEQLDRSAKDSFTGDEEKGTFVIQYSPGLRLVVDDSDPNETRIGIFKADLSARGSASESEVRSDGHNELDHVTGARNDFNSR